MSQLPFKNPVLGALQQAWRQRSSREKLLLRVGASVLLLAALWSLAVAPAWQTWKKAPAQQALLDAQTQTMRQLQAQAKIWQASRPISRSESIEWLETHLGDLGPDTQISLQGDQATLSLIAASAEDLAHWLTMAREWALAMPVQAQLQRGSSTSTSATADKQVEPSVSPADSSALLRGTLVLRLP